MVLKACLMESGYSEETRHTVDIDANLYSDTPPTDEQIAESINNALVNGGIDLDISIYRTHGNGRSAGLELTDKSTGELLFTMDIDVNHPPTPTKIYEIEGILFCGAAPIQMIADKVSAISTDKVFRRIKDVVDLYYISKGFDFNKKDVLQTINHGERSLDTFDGFLHRIDYLKHSYENFRFTGSVSKSEFEEVYESVKSFIKDILPKERIRDDNER